MLQRGRGQAGRREVVYCTTELFFPSGFSVEGSALSVWEPGWVDIITRPIKLSCGSSSVLSVQSAVEYETSEVQASEELKWSVRPALGGPGALNKAEEKEEARGEPQGAIVALLALQAKRETAGLQEPNKTAQTLQSCCCTENVDFFCFSG
ncbi:hypothetical protein KOW79_020730 [Hemibagrus wyckioides]|uniref:Uncharacterized protein n=1 Tax=Hemibagrus wyckioides TaxID=337641 RepID=A0A9D3N4K9_9TELE|nr:hypothetical protein KOW79_020730 [Hemibagrus wyckioides]